LGDTSAAPIQHLLSGARQKKYTWLRPKTVSLAKPGEELHRILVGHTAGVYALAITSDSRQVFSAGGDKTIRIWDLEQGQETASIEGFASNVNALALTPDELYLLAGFMDGAIQVIDWRTLRIVARLLGHSKQVNAICCNENSPYFVSASADKTLITWDIHKLKKHRVLKGHSGVVTDVVLSPNGKIAVSASNDKTLRIWDIKHGRKLGVMQSDWPQSSLAISPDGRTLVSGSDMVPILWDLELMKKKVVLTGTYWPMHESNVDAVAVTPDGSQIISGDGDHFIRVWENKAEYPYKGGTTIWATHLSAITDLIVSANGRWVLSSSVDKTIRIWNLENPESQTKIPFSTASDAPVKWIGFGPANEILNLKILYERDKYGDMSEWESTLTLPKDRLKWFYKARAIVQNHGRSILWVDVGNDVKIIDIQTSKVIKKANWIWRKLAISNDDSLFAGFGGGDNNRKIEVWESLTGNPILRVEEIEEIVSLIFSSNLKWLVAGNKQGEIVYWPLPDKEKPATRFDFSTEMKVIPAHQVGLKGIKPSSGSNVISYGDDGRICLWDLHSGKNLRTIKLDWKGIKNIIVSADSLWLGAVSNRGEAKIWNNSTGNLCITLPAGSVKVTEEYSTNIYENPVSNLKFMPGRRWVVVNDGNQITVWKLDRDKKVTAFTGETVFETFAVSPDESLIAVGTVLGELHQLVIEL
jgi:WD40 repeat protein